jgi:hypothetical protein
MAKLKQAKVKEGRKGHSSKIKIKDKGIRRIEKQIQLFTEDLSLKIID